MKLAKAPVITLDFPGKIGDILEMARERPEMCLSPDRLEFRLCALLAAWETVTVGNAQSHHWQHVWQKHCLKLHHGKAGLILADPIKGPSRQLRCYRSQSEKLKAYQNVVHGLRRVFKGMVEHYQQSEPNGARLTSDPSVILAELISRSFRLAKSFAGPAGLESFLLTLIESYESSLSRNGSSNYAIGLWRREIQRKRSLGPPATRTLADVASLDVRLQRARSPGETRPETIQQITKYMPSLVRQLSLYLAHPLSLKNAFSPMN